MPPGFPDGILYLDPRQVSEIRYASNAGLESLELYGEVTHELSLPYDLHTASDLMTTVVNVLESSCDHVHVVVCINATCDAQTEKVETTETVLTSYRITVCKNVTDLDRKSVV